MDRAPMKMALSGVLFFLAVIRQVFPNSTNPTLSACIGEAVDLPSFSKDTICDNPRYILVAPNGTRIQRNTGRFTLKNITWKISELQPSDTGIWTLRRYCDQGPQNCKINLEVNCESLFVNTNSDVVTKCPKPAAIPVDATNIKLSMYCRLSQYPGKVIRILFGGKITKEAKQAFRGKVSVGLDGYTLNISNIERKHAGNYTCSWLWNYLHNRASRKFTYHVSVTAEPLKTTQHAVTRTWANTSTTHKTTQASTVAWINVNATENTTQAPTLAWKNVSRNTIPVKNMTTSRPNDPANSSSLTTIKADKHGLAFLYAFLFIITHTVSMKAINMSS